MTNKKRTMVFHKVGIICDVYSLKRGDSKVRQFLARFAQIKEKQAWATGSLATLHTSSAKARRRSLLCTLAWVDEATPAEPVFAPLSAPNMTWAVPER